MIERELKYWPVNSQILREKLASANASLDYSSLVKTLYFDYAGKSPDLLFRLRDIGGQASVTAKGMRHIGDLKSRDEFETIVDSMELAQKFMQEAGFSVAGSYEERWREQWSLPTGVKVVIDRLSSPLIPDYVEIEAEDGAMIECTARSLGLFGLMCAPITFEQLACMYGVSFFDLQTTFPLELMQGRMAHNRTPRHIEVSGELTRLAKYRNREVEIRHFVAGGLAICKYGALRLEHPENMEKLLELAGVS